MPVIRLAGKGGGFFQQAGQAAGAYDQVTADQRRQQYARERIAGERLHQLRMSKIQQGIQAQQQDFQNQATTRSLDLREKAIEAQRVRSQMRGAVRQSNGVPISGAGVLDMVTRLSALDRQAYEQLAPQLQGMAGFDESNPVTPGKLDALENLPDIYATVAPVYAQAVKRADVQAVENGFQETVTSFIDDPTVLESDREWAQWHSGLADAYARAQRSSGGATMAMMGPVYEQAKLEAARIATVKQQREQYLGKFDQYVQSAEGLDDDDLRSARLRMASMGSSQNPRQVFAEAMVRINPDFRLAHEIGIRAGQGQGFTQAAAMQVQREQAQTTKAPAAVDKPLYSAGTTISAKERPGLTRALLGEPGDQDAAEIVDFLDGLEADPAKVEQLDTVLSRFLLQKRIADGVSAQRYGARIQ